MRKTILLVAVLLWSTYAGAQAQDAPPPALPPEQSEPPKALPLVTEPAPEPIAPTIASKPEAPEAAPVEWWQRSEWWLVFSLWTIALAGIGLAAYTARLWKATADLLRTTRDAGRKELRAYVALDEIFFEDAADTAPGAHKLRVRNYGQTPAYRMSIWCERASHLPKEGIAPYYDAPVVDGQLLHPVQAYTVGLAGAPLYRIGKPGFFTYGRVIYHDIYGEWWVTKFCFRYEGEGAFVPHGDYNDEEGPFGKRPA